MFVITRWAAGLSSEGPREAMRSLNSVGRAILNGDDNSMISDLTDDSSHLSDADDETGTISTEIEEEYGNRLYDMQMVEDEIQTSPSKRLRFRKSASRPLDTIVEISDLGGILALAVPEIGVAVQVSVPTTGYNNVGRGAICEYAKTFIKQVIKAKQILSIYSISSRKAQLRRIK